MFPLQFGLKGKSINVVTACASGTHSIGEAFRTIQCADADVMVAGGTESSHLPLRGCRIFRFDSINLQHRCETMLHSL